MSGIPYRPGAVLRLAGVVLLLAPIYGALWLLERVITPFCGKEGT